MMDKAQEIHGDLEAEVFEQNLTGRNFYAQYGFKLIEKKVHEQTGENLMRLKFTSSSKCYELYRKPHNDLLFPTFNIEQ